MSVARKCLQTLVYRQYFILCDAADDRESDFWNIRL